MALIVSRPATRVLPLTVRVAPALTLTVAGRPSPAAMPVVAVHSLPTVNELSYLSTELDPNVIRPAPVTLAPVASATVPLPLVVLPDARFRVPEELNVPVMVSVPPDNIDRLSACVNVLVEATVSVTLLPILSVPVLELGIVLLPVIEMLCADEAENSDVPFAWILPLSPERVRLLLSVIGPLLLICSGEAVVAVTSTGLAMLTVPTLFKIRNGKVWVPDALLIVAVPLGTVKKTARPLPEPKLTLEPEWLLVQLPRKIKSPAD